MNNLKKLQVVSFILFALLSSTAQASHSSKKTYKGCWYRDKENSWFVGAGIGRSWMYLRNNSTTVDNGAPSPFNLDYYSIKSPSPQTLTQLFVGYRWHKKRKWIPYFSAFVQYRHYGPTRFSGNIYQYSLPEFENYDYHMRYAANLFTLNGKIDLFEYRRILPYISLGAGVIYNYLNNYQELPLPNITPRISPGYSGNVNTNFAFTAGIGIDIKFTKNWWATLGYEYLMQGNIKTRNGESTWSGEHLNFGKNARMSSVFLNISVNIPEGIRSKK